MAHEHASQNRGLNQVVRSSREEGRFGYMFRRLPSFRPSDALLEGLAAGMRQAETEVTDNPKIPAGYTYLGQFLDVGNPEGYGHVLVEVGIRADRN